MSELLVGTRKGLFSVDRRGGEYEVSGVEFLGVPVTAVALDGRDGSTYVEPMRKVPVPWVTDLLWAFEAGHADEPGSLWAGTIPGGLFRSTDRGQSWELMRSLWDHPRRKEWFGGGYDHPGVHSASVDRRDPSGVLVGVSCGGVWRTADGGASWEPAAGLRNAYMPPELEYDPVT